MFQVIVLKINASSQWILSEVEVCFMLDR